MADVSIWWVILGFSVATMVGVWASHSWRVDHREGCYTYWTCQACGDEKVTRHIRGGYSAKRSEWREEPESWICRERVK